MTVQLYSYIILGTSTIPVTFYINFCIHNNKLKKYIGSFGTGLCENSTRWKSCKRVQSRGRGARACLAHALQCLCDGRACCPARALQLVICRS